MSWFGDKIEQAIKKIEDGTYGFCEETGEPIGIERLLVRPTALFCAEEKNRQEKIEKALSKIFKDW